MDADDFGYSPSECRTEQQDQNEGQGTPQCQCVSVEDVNGKDTGTG
jgi:hypothetical protein